MFTVSRYGLLSVCFFLFFSMLFRFVLPFGDEPDFSVRAVALSAHAEKSFYPPYHFINNTINEIETQSTCRIESSPFSMLASINASSCAQGYEQIAKRFLFILVTAVPLFVVVVFTDFGTHSLTRPDESHKLNDTSCIFVAAAHPDNKLQPPPTRASFSHRLFIK